jgi:hypothetical protein
MSKRGRSRCRTGTERIKIRFARMSESSKNANAQASSRSWLAFSSPSQNHQIDHDNPYQAAERYERFSSSPPLPPCLSRPMRKIHNHQTSTDLWPRAPSGRRTAPARRRSNERVSPTAATRPRRQLLVLLLEEEPRRGRGDSPAADAVALAARAAAPAEEIGALLSSATTGRRGRGAST